MKKIFFSSLLVLLTMIGIAPTVQAQSTPQYGEELLTNIPPAATDFTGWTTSGSVECSEGWFKTSYTEGTISQTIDLAAKGYTPIAENTLFLYAATEYKVGWATGNQDGSAQMYVECLDAEGKTLATNTFLNRTGKFGTVETTLVSATLNIPANTTKLRYVLKGKDQCRWTGYFGPWFKNMSCIVYEAKKVPIQVSIAPELGDSITLSKTTDLFLGDTITVSPTYSKHSIISLSTNKGLIINTNQVVCLGTNIIINAHLKYPHAIKCNGTKGTIVATPAQAGMGDTVTLSSSLGDQYFVIYTTDIDVVWIDANRFIMPDSPIIVTDSTTITIKSLPYFEGFENGNTDRVKVAEWVQQGEDSWVANNTKTDKNRKPFTGSWNATHFYSNTVWLFQAFTFEAGKKYRFFMPAICSYAGNILVKLGNRANKDAMSVTIVPETVLSTTDYKYLCGQFTVDKTGTYVIGICGCASSMYNYTSIDDIQVLEVKPHTISCKGIHATLRTDKTTACIGDTVTLSYTLDENYVWGAYTTNTDVIWIDDNRFIMPDVPVAVGNTASAAKALPYFEGFENGNTQDAVVANWFQQSEDGNNSWVANSTQTDYNRTPYAGSWNATLYGYNTDWLFQGFLLEAGKEYAFSMWARSYHSTEISVMLGSEANKDAMSVTVIPTTTLSTSDYQYLSGKMTVETTGIYVIGIRGYSSYDYNAISIDNIMVREAQPHTITCTGTHATLTADKATASIGDTVTLSCILDENYALGTYTYITDINVTWVDANRFIMPDEAISIGNITIAAKTIPYFEGFEEGNTQDAVVVNWLQQSEVGSHSWVANSTNTDYNRTPYAGSKWNATLHYSNTDWLFQALVLEAGENYVLSLYARQSGSTTSYANITAKLGTASSKYAMTTTLIPEKGLTSGDYQLLTDTFQVAETKAYVLGIKGYISPYPWYISMDNIFVEQEVYPRKDSLFFDVLTEESVRTALAALTLTAVDTKGNTKCTITNLPENWVLDLENKKATYTVADNLLPMGYYCTETITVDLVLNQYTVTVTAENGTIAGAGTYDYGTEVTLTAIANEGYSFLNWSDGTKGATYTFTLTQDTVLTAIFVQYGEELLTNIPPVATDFTDWTTDGSVECKEGWFKTGNSVSTISQTIDLAAKGYTTPVAENTFFIYAAAEYCEYWGGSARGVAKVYVEFLDENGNVLAADYVLNRENYSGYVDITRVSNKFVIPANTTKVRYVLQGKDQKGWGGCYGPWFRNMSCKVFDYTKVGTSINVSVDAALGDSITLSKTSDFLYGDTITVTAKYPEHPILWITSNEGQLLEDNQLICWGTDIVVGAQLKYDHTISFNATHATIISDTTKAGGGDTITLSYTMEEGYYFVEYTTDVEVDWIDANRFIMPDANITIGVKFIAPNALPYFEGFENGNSQDAHIEGWAWQKEGSKDWLANTSNTDFNQKPYKGSWNATLEFNNAAWLFQAFTFEKGKTYCISFYARTSGSATLRVMLGNSNHKDSMQVTLIPNTSISNGNYKKISGAIKVEKDGNYVIGIRGYMNDIRNALSIDNVVVEEAQAHAITLNKGMHATLTADKASAYIGDTVTLSSSMEDGYALGRYTTNINVTWIDANRFIMPDENVAVGNTAITVKSLPYFEGFEDGNTQGSVVADWLQQSENGYDFWVANTTYTTNNRTPYAGSSWNATLYRSNTDWLFQALALEVGENYVLSLYARQDGADTSYANITAKLGTACHKDAMTTTLINQTGLTNGDYQLLTDTFQVAETKAYVLGIKGYISGSSYYISMDNILVEQEVYPASVDTLYFDVLTENAVRTALATLSLTAQDSKGNTKHTFDNLAENWVLDLENKKATYTVADNLLPMGYFFSNTTATISVALQLNTYSLSFATNDAAMGSVSSTHEADTYNYGTVITLTATADEHYHFVQWSDGATEATYTFTLTQDTTLTAIFEGDPHTVTVTAGENGSVKVTANGEATTETTFTYGTKITLTATANTGYSFDKWSDGNTDNPRTITVTENVTLSATFKQGAPTQLLEATTETKVQKVMRNGQVFILRNGNTYDLTGRKAE